MKTSFHLFVVKTGGGRGKQGFNFCYLKFDMPGDHANVCQVERVHRAQRLDLCCEYKCGSSKTINGI